MRGVWLAYGQGPTTPLAWQASNHASGVAGVQRGSITLQPFGRLRARVCRGLVSSNFKEKVFPCGPLPVLSLSKGGPPEWAASGTLR